MTTRITMRLLQSCAGKIVYPSPQKAWAAVRARAKRTSKYRSVPYKCHCCPGWHLGDGLPVERFERRSRRRALNALAAEE